MVGNTANNSYGTAILTHASYGSYTTWDEYGYVHWRFDETGLYIEFGDDTDYFIKM